MDNKNTTSTPSVTGTQPVIKTQEEAGATTNDLPKVTVTTNPVVTQSTPPEKTETKKKKVEVDSDVLDRILAELGELKTKTSEFEKTASQDQIRKIEALRASGKLVKAVKVRRFNDALVVGWKVLRDRVWVADKQLHEEQDVMVYLNNGTEVETSLREFTRSASYEAYEVIKEAKTFNGEMEYVLLIDGGAELTINGKYVN